MRNNFATHKEYEKFVVYFLYRTYPTILKTNYDESVGELLSAIYSAAPRYDPEKGAKSTYFWKVCQRRFMNFMRNEGVFYSKHKVGSSFTNLPSKEVNPLLYLQYDELRTKVKNSALPKRSKEVVLKYIEDPFASYSDMGKELGVTRQAIESHIRSSKQYLSRYNILLD